MVATRSARRRGTPLLALWRREDARATVVDFLPTRSIATLPFVAKPLREAQMPLLLTAVRRRCAKDSIYRHPPTAQDLLNNLLVGEPQHFCETWERGYSPQWRLACRHDTPLAINSSVEQSPDGGYFLELNGSSNSHRGYALSLRARNLLVKRLRVSMSYVECFPDHHHHRGAVGYVMLCGPDAPTHPYAGHSAIDDFMGGPRFSLRENGQVSLNSEVSA